ncbi:MAG TPA: hypothetical protein VHF25_03385 [Nitriliruptorales bacterium]|nr:hypothetical protein [Nitriliruptorales bacterium]
MSAVDAAAERSLVDLRSRALVGAPLPLPQRLPARVGRALHVATTAGAPAIPALDAALAARADTARRERALHVATSQARAVTAGLVALPVFGLVGVGRLLGEPLWRFYLTTTGMVVGTAAAALLAGGVLLARALVRRVARGRRPVPTAATVAAVVAPLLVLAGPIAAALGAATAAVWGSQRPRPSHPARIDLDEIADLVATALAGGLSPAAALRATARTRRDLAGDLRRAAAALELDATVTLDPGVDRVVATLRTAVTWGAPAVPALRRLAADLRAEELARSLAAVERLPALLVFPTALCLLPASLLLVGAPLVAVGLEVVAGT